MSEARLIVRRDGVHGSEIDDRAKLLTSSDTVFRSGLRGEVALFRSQDDGDDGLCAPGFILQFKTINAAAPDSLRFIPRAENTTDGVAVHFASDAAAGEFLQLLERTLRRAKAVRYLRATTLHRRGWSNDMIARLLGEPDRRGKRYCAGLFRCCYYRRDRVEQVETTKEWRKARMGQVTQ